MTAARDIYDSDRLADVYAVGRPPVHRFIVQKIGHYLNAHNRLRSALDVGCGSGLSSAALKSLAEVVVGIEPLQAMLKHSRSISSHTLFLVGQAESLPFRGAAFELVTAAGALNYVDLDRGLPELARVLAPDGLLAIYDFSAGRRLVGSNELARWHDTFKERYPSPPGYFLDARAIAYAEFGLALDAYEALDVAIPMTLASYVAYAMSETGVELAFSRGVPESEIRDWCQGTLKPVFRDETRDVIFEAYVAYVRRRGQAGASRRSSCALPGPKSGPFGRRDVTAEG